jgi:hypothetical protein
MEAWIPGIVVIDESFSGYAVFRRKQRQRNGGKGVYFIVVNNERGCEAR